MKVHAYLSIHTAALHLLALYNNNNKKVVKMHYTAYRLYQKIVEMLLKIFMKSALRANDPILY